MNFSHYNSPALLIRIGADGCHGYLLGYFYVVFPFSIDTDIWCTCTFYDWP